MSVYVVDTNFFIEAHRAYYPIDVVHSFWNKVSDLAGRGRIISIDKVKKEIYGSNDALEEWCKSNLPDDFFKKTTLVINEYKIVTGWATGKADHFKPAALSEFLDADEADAFIIAYALADPENKVVVTQEISEPDRKNKVKIPDACIGVNVKYMNTMEMLRELGESF